MSIGSMPAEGLNLLQSIINSCAQYPKKISFNISCVISQYSLVNISTSNHLQHGTNYCISSTIQTIFSSESDVKFMIEASGHVVGVKDSKLQRLKIM